jgi:methylmalonyl-CoA/ethylmalonyl-CoA epimerase
MVLLASDPETRGQGAREGGEQGLLIGIDHVGIAVEDLDSAVRIYVRALGAEPVHREVVPSQGVEEALFRMGDSYVQLVSALHADSPVGRFLAKRGPGLHHIGFRVDDVGGTLKELTSQGVEVVDEEPRPGSRGTTVAFLHPRGMGGVLIELVQVAQGGEPA